MLILGFLPGVPKTILAVASRCKARLNLKKEAFINPGLPMKIQHDTTGTSYASYAATKLIQAVYHFVAPRVQPWRGPNHILDHLRTVSV